MRQYKTLKKNGPNHRGAEAEIRGSPERRQPNKGE